jgi:hypothetical protein
LAASSSSGGNGDKARNRGGMVGVGGKRARRDGDGLCLYIYAPIWLFVWFEKIKRVWKLLQIYTG